MTKKFVKTERGERIDQPDFQHAAEVSQLDSVNALGQAVLVGTDAESNHYILRGFACSNPSGKILRVSKDEGELGAAIMSWRDRGEVKEGAVVIEGDAVKEIDITSFPSATYGVFIRFELLDDSYQNRIFWNPISPPPTEAARSVPTRRAANWSLAVELTSPGPEWMKIADVVQSTMAITDQREFFFEGKAANSFAVVDGEWGTANDRNTDRATYGVKGLRRFVRGVQRQLQDIIGESGPAGWYKSVERNLKQLLALDGSRDMAGVLRPNLDNTHSLGQLLRRWSDIHAVGGHFSTGEFFGNVTMHELLDLVGTGSLRSLTPTTEIDLQTPRWSANFSQAGGINRTAIFGSDGNTATGTSRFRIYRAVSGAGGAETVEFVFNAHWLEGTDEWVQTDTSAASAMFELSKGKFYIYYKAAGAANWVNAGWGAVVYLFELSTGQFTTTNIAALGAGTAIHAVNGAVQAGTTMTAQGNITSTAGEVSGLRFVPLDLLPTTTAPAINRIYRNTTIRSWINSNVIGGDPEVGMIGFNIASIVLEGTDTLKVNFARSFSSSSYAVSGQASDITGGSPTYFPYILRVIERNGSYCRLKWLSSATDTNVNFTITNVEFSLMFVGDQA